MHMPVPVGGLPPLSGSLGPSNVSSSPPLFSASAALESSLSSSSSSTCSSPPPCPVTSPCSGPMPSGSPEAGRPPYWAAFPLLPPPSSSSSASDETSFSQSSSLLSSAFPSSSGLRSSDSAASFSAPLLSSSLPRAPPPSLAESFRAQAASLLIQGSFSKSGCAEARPAEGDRVLLAAGNSLVSVGDAASLRKDSSFQSFVPDRQESSFVNDIWQYVLGREERKTSLGYDYLVKLVIVGDSSVGKSCLLSRFAKGRFVARQRTTLGVDFETRTLDIDGTKVKIQLWDTAGHERFRSVTLSYYRSAMGALVVFDVTKRESFESVRSWLHELDERAPQNVQRILVGNKADLEERAVSREESRRLAAEFNLRYIETSAKTGQHVRAAFVELTLLVVRRLRQLEMQCTDACAREDNRSESCINRALSHGCLDTVQLAEGPIERKAGFFGAQLKRLWGGAAAGGVLEEEGQPGRRRVARMEFRRYAVDDYLDVCLDV
ncbi:putative Ras-related protein Rab2BV [Besnoitia besnoiti]|uniref:Putative Ras-related protein Rab2BV n=1 Tax=Besnoitia besnoiti TaxID=94643 RepID=A0A2A9MLB1_BESBE|nr:putative Ras-related protein Rab2BV [Besnoitia besnoiti]PFH36473.1 putative Ras-related protein Rab2BV [Besnoitia besnoiti]